MAHKPTAIVLDSWAVIAYLEDEKAGEKVAEILTDAHEHGIPLKMSVINLGEVWYIIARETSVHEADKSLEELKELGIEFVNVDWIITQCAAMFKSKHRMSYADCFAAALAKSEKADLVTGDKEFKQMEREVKIHWVG